jgi:DNA (cytosine-5)-methyltransferase 1
VKNLRLHDSGNTYERIKWELEQEGYQVFSSVFNTANFHLPQIRNRVLIFATSEPVPADFESTFNSKNVQELFDEVYKERGVLHYKDTLEILSCQVSEKYYLSDRIKPTLLADGSANFKSKSDINQLIARTLTASMHKMHRACQDNYYSQDFIDSRGGINHVYDYTKEQLATLRIRKLTPEEAFMLQGFPAEFVTNARRAGVSDTSLYKQAGNAVSVNVIYAVIYFLIVNNIIHE